MPFSQIIPPSPSPTESKRLFCKKDFFPDLNNNNNNLRHVAAALC